MSEPINPSNSRLQALPLEILCDVLERTGNLKVREACRYLCEIIDTFVLPIFWRELKNNPPKGSIKITQLMHALEQNFLISNKPLNHLVLKITAFLQTLFLRKNRPKISYIKLFRKLNKQIAVQSEIKIQTSHLLIYPSHFTKLQQMLDFLKIWRKVHQSIKIPIPFESCSVSEIRTRLKDPNYVQVLEPLDKLDLSSLQLTNFPREMNVLSQLQYLNLDHNLFENAPCWGRLTNLKILLFNYNELATTSGLGELSHLEILSLSCNQVEKVTDLSTLTNLRTLLLDHNLLKTVSNLNECTRLERIYLNDNLIEKRPHFPKLTYLSVLDLDDNPCTCR